MRFLRVKVRVRLDEALLMGLMVALDTGGFAWVTIRYERIYKLCRRCGRIGHSYAHCPWDNDEVSDALDTQMNRLLQCTNVEQGISFTRTHFINEARRFFGNQNRKSIVITSHPDPNGEILYRPRAAAPLNYDFDPWGYLDHTGAMQSFSPEMMEAMENNHANIIDTDNDDDLLPEENPLPQIP